MRKPAGVSRIFRAVPRYYFHVFNDEVSIDEEGSVLPDLDSARETAMDGCRDLVCESVRKGHLNLEHRIDVADEKGEVLMRVTFRDAFTLQG